MTSTSAFGDKETENFYQLTPDIILNAIEKACDVMCTGRVVALNSFENRVYEIEVENEEPTDEEENSGKIQSQFLVAKFYRPGRWTKEQILDEHEFMKDLVKSEIPVVAPIILKNKTTLAQLEGTSIYFAVFPKCRGRNPDEITEQDVGPVARLLARLHNIGAAKQSKHRLRLDVQTYGWSNLEHLKTQNIVPENFKKHFFYFAEEICKTVEPMLAKANYHRIHGDCHIGNLIHGKDGFFFVDFDDMLIGPAVQDVWLLVPGRDAESQALRQKFVSSYELMREFDYTSLQLIEPLRALRFIHFCTWLAKRWQDPAFPKAFPYFGSEKYWGELVQDLSEQLELIKNPNQNVEI